MAFWDRLRSPKPALKARGASGRAHYNGFLDLEELNVDLMGPSGLRVFDKMYRTDPDVRRVVWMVCNPIISGTWSIEPFGGDEASDEDRKVASATEWALFERMRPKLPRHLAQALPVTIRSGFCPFEQVWMMDERDGRKLLVPKTLDLRLPRSIHQWNQDQGELTELVQFLPTGGTVPLPASDLVYYRLGAEGDNWEGTSLLRAAYKPWFLKDKLERIDAMGQENEAFGIPVCYPPSSADDPTRDDVEKMLAGMRGNEQGYIMSPGPHAENSENGQGWRFEIITFKSGESRDAQSSLKYHSDKIAAAFIAEFMRLGQSGVGARATADVQQDPFLAAVEAIASEFEDTLNEQLVQRFVALNFDVEEPPKLSMSLVDSTTLSELKDYVQGLVSSGVLAPDGELEDFLRARADLPPADPKIRAAREKAREESLRQAAAPSDPNAGPAAGPRGSGKDAAGHDAGRPAAEPGPAKQLSRQDRSLRWWEDTMALDRIESAIDGARAAFEQAGAEQARRLAAEYAPKAVKGQQVAAKPPAELLDALHEELMTLYATGRSTVSDELAAQRGEPAPVPVTLARGDVKELARRARLAAQAVAGAIWQAVSRAALGREISLGQVQVAGERAGMASLRGEAQLHAAPALNLGRSDEATVHADEIAGARYTSILDPNRCRPCANADDDVLRRLDDPVYLAHKPPNPSCEGGDRCRCMSFYQLATEEPAALARVGALIDSTKAFALMDQMVAEIKELRAMDEPAGQHHDQIELTVAAAPAPDVTVNISDIKVPPADVTVNMPEGPAPNVEAHVHVPEQATPQVTVNVPEQQPPDVKVDAPVEVNMPDRKKRLKVERDNDGRISEIRET